MFEFPNITKGPYKASIATNQLSSGLIEVLSQYPDPGK